MYVLQLRGGEVYTKKKTVPMAVQYAVNRKI